MNKNRSARGRCPCRRREGRVVVDFPSHGMQHFNGVPQNKVSAVVDFARDITVEGSLPIALAHVVGRRTTIRIKVRPIGRHGDPEVLSENSGIYQGTPHPVVALRTGKSTRIGVGVKARSRHRRRDGTCPTPPPVQVCAVKGSRGRHQWLPSAPCTPPVDVVPGANDLVSTIRHCGMEYGEPRSKSRRRHF